MSEDRLEWMVMYLAIYRGEIEEKVRKMCAVKGCLHMYDDVLQHAMMVACEKEDYDPRRASFPTYVVNLAKWHLGEMLSGDYWKHRHLFNERPVVFVDEYAEEEGTYPSPSEQFNDPFDGTDWLPFWYAATYHMLDERGKDCLAFMVSRYKRGYTLKELGNHLGVSHTTAAAVRRDVVSEAKRSLKWTKALERLSEHWLENGTF